MQKIKKMIKWCLITNKRFLKKPLFLILLVSIPVLSMSMQIVSREEKSMLTVLLVLSEEPFGSDFAEKFRENSGIIEYEKCSSKDMAYEKVRNGSADCAVVFPEKWNQALMNYVRKKGSEPLFVMYVKEDTIPVMLAREQIYGMIYPEISKATVEYYLETENTKVETETMEKTYQKYENEDSIFQLSYLNGQIGEKKEDYLIAPIRGILAVFLMLLTLAAGMFYLEDKKSGIFLMFRRREQFCVLSYLWVAALDGAVVVLGALYVSGNFVGWWYESGILFLYTAAVTGFGCVLLKLISSLSVFGSIVLLVTLASFLLCPVFWELREIQQLGRIFPAWYYLNGIYDPHTLILLGGYAGLTTTIGILLPKRSGRN